MYVKFLEESVYIMMIQSQFNMTIFGVQWENWVNRHIWSWGLWTVC